VSERFAAFSFVDRITRRTAHRIEGRYAVPGKATGFPASLMAEAVGQLAAWSAMSSLDFRLRPVAGIAAQTRYFRLPRPGQTLMLEAEIARCDGEAVAYSGRAAIDGQCALELNDCIGPMLPMEDFDSPAAVRADFDTLCGPGAAPDRFAGVPAPQLEMTGHVAGVRIEASLRVPARSEAAFFGDHFPRRPVYPGTLLMDALAGLAVQLAQGGVGGPAAANRLPRVVSDVKIRAFTPPGAALALLAELLDSDSRSSRIRLMARADGKLVASARIEVGPPGDWP
jgi:3-hydroxyacyl-[acyl-carrier-protein] dehydratase